MVSSRITASQKLANSRAAAQAIATRRARQTPSWGAPQQPGMRRGSQLGVWSTPTEYAARAQRSISPDTLHTFTGRTVRAVAGAGALLVLVLGVVLGAALTHEKGAQGGSQTVASAQVENSALWGHRAPDSLENAALDTARTVTGGPCSLVWNVDSYEVVCFPSNHPTPNK